MALLYMLIQYLDARCYFLSPQMREWLLVTRPTTLGIVLLEKIRFCEEACVFECYYNNRFREEAYVFECYYNNRFREEAYVFERYCNIRFYGEAYTLVSYCNTWFCIQNDQNVV